MQDMISLVSQIAVITIDGLALGLQLALIAVGITIIFGLGEILNISHGEFAVLTSIVAVLLSPSMGLVLAILTGLAASIILGIFTYKLVLRPAFNLTGDERILAGLFLTLGLYLTLSGYFTNQFPTIFLSIKAPISIIGLGGITFRFSSVLSAAISVALLLSLGFFLKWTSVGKAIRATAQNEVGAEISGVPIDNIRLLTFIIGSLLAGSAGVARAMSASVGPGVGIELTILALLVSVVGGIRSIFGTIVAGVMLGVIYTLTAYVVGAYFSNIMMLVAASLTILLRPEGILGETE
ncbi:MAG: branched-chain amino acid ABC transporter permease [Candidatus Caldarchaeum sp.]